VFGKKFIIFDRIVFFYYFPSHRNAVSDLNNKYKHCLIMCKQLSTQEELLTHDEMKGVTLTADKLLYLHAIDLCLNAASLEFFGKAQEVRKMNFFDEEKFYFFI
jgi:hypothetical protein